MRNKQESLMWQCPMPSYDFDLWHHESRWLVNPNSGRKLEEMRVNNKGFPCYIKHPDASFWEADVSSRRLFWQLILTASQSVRRRLPGIDTCTACSRAQVSVPGMEVIVPGGSPCAEATTSPSWTAVNAHPRRAQHPQKAASESRWEPST